MSTELSAYYQRTLDELNDAIALSSLAGFIIGHAPLILIATYFPPV